MKHRLRTQMKATLAGMSAGDAAAASEAACSAVLELPEYRRSRAVMLYAPIPGEVDCIPIAMAAWAAGKTVLLPRASWKDRHMEAVACQSLDEEMVLNEAGIREPAGGEPWPVEKIDLIIVPALAYDRRGNRLGRGGGFYDRFLARGDMRGVTCGLAFAVQVVEELPVHSNDYPVEILVTDKEVLRFAGPRHQLRLFERPGPAGPAGRENHK
ncbi:MAG: 5-formyltetrahydrofolate cyclo-ligase [Planctomycetes bacterium]|nr:5-formyltetrahydrofolate cyclo-ligase [Planctomycetota bacterium]